MVHAGVKPSFVPLEAALRRVRGVAGTAARAYLQLNLTPERWAGLPSPQLACPSPHRSPYPSPLPQPHSQPQPQPQP